MKCSTESCKREAVEGIRLCQRCREMHRRSDQKRREQRYAAGLCGWSGCNVKRNGRFYCHDHAEIINRARRRQYAAKKVSQ